MALVKNVAMMAVGVLGFFPAARGQFDLEALSEIASQLPGDYEIDLTQLREPTPEEWRQMWEHLNRVLQSGSLVDMAEVRPYAEMALQFLDEREDGRPLADWLRQRVDYLWMAEQVVSEARPPSVSKPPPPQTIKPPAPAKPRPAPAVAAKKSMDVQRWVQRVQSRGMPKGAAAYVPKLKPVFRAHGVPDALVWLAEVESSFDPEAKSPVGALGLYQFMPATAERFGLQVRPDDERVIPERSAEAAAKYLKFLHGRFGSWPLALAAYNAGEGRVGKLLSKHKASTFEGIADYLPSETRMYVPKIAAVIKVREGLDVNRL